MTKIVIVPEPHLWDKTFENRIRYPNEIEGYLESVRHMTQNLQGDGHDVKVIFMGDIFHRGYTDAIVMLKHVSFFSSWSDDLCGELYSLVGNHELTYNRMNPYWMMADVQSKFFDYIKTIPEYNVGAKCIKVPDELKVGKDLFIFGHYHRDEFDYDFSSYDKVYFLTHNSLLDAEVNNAIVNTYHLDVKAEYIDAKGVRQQGMLPPARNLAAVFVGHMHCAFGRYHVDENINGIPMDFMLQYLQSIGRTNHTEVNDSNLVRSLPVISYDESGNSEISYLQLELLSREKTVKESKVLASQMQYQRGKELRQMRNGSVSALTPVDDLRNWIQQVAPSDSILFESLLRTEPITELNQLLREAENLG